MIEPDDFFAALADPTRRRVLALLQALRDDPVLYNGCIAGAPGIDGLRTWLAEAGFVDVRIEPKAASGEFIAQWGGGRRVEDYVAAATIGARRPADLGGRS